MKTNISKWIVVALVALGWPGEDLRAMVGDASARFHDWQDAGCNQAQRHGRTGAADPQPLAGFEQNGGRAHDSSQQSGQNGGPCIHKNGNDGVCGHGR